MNLNQVINVGNFVQQSPIYFRLGAQTIAAVKIDTAKISGKNLQVSGWSAGGIKLQLLCNDQPMEQKLTHSSRADVAESLQMAEPDEGFGINLLATSPKIKEANYSLEVQLENGRQIRSFRYPLILEAVPGKNSFHIDAIGCLDFAAASPFTKVGVVYGWVIHDPEVNVWLENEDDECCDLSNAVFVPRQDVLDTHGESFGCSRYETGFILLFENIMPGENLRLMAASSDTDPITLNTITCTKLETSPVSAARWLWGFNNPPMDLANRFSRIDSSIIDQLISRQQRTWANIPIKMRQLGNPLINPTVSVIVPLYGRSDFVEHQLIEFCRDAWFIQNAELIYVLDDPKLTDDFPALAEHLYRLYRLPFKWVWGGINRGFSGANNLGADQATGKHLLFLNSDAFPQQPGWLQPLLSVLDDRPEIGAVGPRLVHADGSIQHAGMEFLRREELGIYINHHPFMGLSPMLDPAHQLTLVPAITGACLAMRRSDFDRIGGWDTGYLIGDFEDSDLCLKLHAEGLKTAYLPTVQLVHLERQSFKFLGQDDFRLKVTIYNAVRHQNRWQHLIEELICSQN